MSHTRLIARAGIVLGVWLMISPWIFGFVGVNLARWNNLAIGLAVALASLWVVLADDGVLSDPHDQP